MNTNTYPIFKKNRGVFLREENEGYHLLVHYGLAGENLKLINSTTKEIMDLCDGNNSIIDIISNQSNKFPEVDNTKIYQDVIETILIFDKNDLLKWKNNDNPFIINDSQFKYDIDDDLFVVKAVSGQFYEILNYLKIIGISTPTDIPTNKSLIHPLVRNSILYSEIFLRNRLFNFSEDFYILKNKKNEILGMISLIDEYPIANRAFLSIISINNDFNLSDGVKNILNAIYEDKKNTYTKIKCSILSDNTLGNEFEQILINSEFEKEAVFKDEYGYTINESVYSRSFVN